MNDNFVSWVHFGDLHITGANDQNYRDFLALIERVNHEFPSVNFALLPGDNADDGEEDEYELVRRAVSRLAVPLHAIPGDHDIAAGSLGLFQQYLSPTLYRSFTLGRYHFVLLNSVAAWQPPTFGLGPDQMAWLRADLQQAASQGLTTVLFLHAYPSEHGSDASELKDLIRHHHVLVADMGHTHYNELANDGHTIYSTTRSTGQIEEGPPGFSIAAIDSGVVSWRFRPLADVSPFVMLTSPSDERLITQPNNPNHLLMGTVLIKACTFSSSVEHLTFSVDHQPGIPLSRTAPGLWIAEWDSTEVPDGLHRLTVSAMHDSDVGEDGIRVLVSQSGGYSPPPRVATEYDNAIGSWPEKHIPGTQLGPNENGHGWPRRTPEPPSQ